MKLGKRKWRITVEKKQRGEVLGVKTSDIESFRKPKVGEGWVKLLAPPIHHTITKVEEIKKDEEDI